MLRMTSPYPGAGSGIDKHHGHGQTLRGGRTGSCNWQICGRSTHVNSFGRILSFGSLFEEFIATELRNAEFTAVRR
jgi:hypothetical protein